MSNQADKAGDTLSTALVLTLGLLFGFGVGRSTVAEPGPIKQVRLDWGTLQLSYEAMQALEYQFARRSKSEGINVDAAELEAHLERRSKKVADWGDIHDELLSQTKHSLRLEVAYRRDRALLNNADPDKILLEVRQLERILGELPKSSAPWWERAKLDFPHSFDSNNQNQL